MGNSSSSTTSKKCEGCGILKEFSEFYKHQSSADGYRKKCKECSNLNKGIVEKTNQIDKNNKNNKNVKLINATAISSKLCKSCGLTKPIKEFYTHPQSHDRYKSTCKQCDFGGTESRNLADPDWFTEYGYLYVLMEREFTKTGEMIFKIGMTDQFDPATRFRGYPKSSKLFLVIAKKNARKSEFNAINMLNARTDIKHRTDIGNEYYEGELEEIKNIIYFA